MSINEFGKIIKYYRNKNKHTSKHLAARLGITRSYLSRIENGYDKPTKQFVRDIIDIYSLNKKVAIKMWCLAGYEFDSSGGLIITEKNRKGVVKMQNGKSETGKEMKEIKVALPNTPVLYSDSAFITENQFGIVFDFAQSVASTNKQNVVARIGMSKEHAKALLKILEKKLEKVEKTNLN
jgi:transcriptional regulator with XRE-family HTH domain